MAQRMAALELFLERAGSGPDQPLEGAVHVALVGKADLGGDGAKGVRVFGDHAARRLNAEVLKVLAGSAS